MNRAVAISNGFTRFHLVHAAAEAASRNRLFAFLTGAYPMPEVERVLGLTALDRLSPMRRLLARRDEVPAARIDAFFACEALYQSGQALVASGLLPEVGARLRLAAYHAYGRRARAALGARLRGDGGLGVYHYRAGLGGASVAPMKSRGIIALCDHSIAHPQVLTHLVASGGQFPDAVAFPALDPFWRLVLDDIEAADAIVVNSDFVRDSFLHLGWPSSRVHVVYLGVDNGFIEAVDAARAKSPPAAEGSPLRFLFAGAFSPRKGSAEIVEAFAALRDRPWTLSIAGPIPRETARRHEGFLADPRVRLCGNLSRADLARAMVMADVFIFPSRAEGSARVVFEALAAGCYVVTTRNSGSIVEDGVHGRLVPVGEAASLAAVLRQMIDDPAPLAATGRANAELIRARYRQAHYGDKLDALYDRLLEERHGHAASSS